MTNGMAMSEPPDVPSDAVLQVTINGLSINVPKDASILDSLQISGVCVPSLCNDPRLKPVGACRLCLVEVEGESQSVAACITPVAPGMRILTETPALLRYRESMLRLLATTYRSDGADSNTEFSYWLRHFGIVPEGTQHESIDSSNPYIHVDMSQCIRCFRCVRICAEVQGQFVWNIRNRGQDTRIVAGLGTLATSDCVSCGACVDTCPTDALRDKRSLQINAPDAWTRTTCPYCGTGCELFAGTRDDKLVSIKPALDAPVNKGHLCSKGRYAYDFVHSSDRILQPMLRQEGTWVPVSWDDAIAATRRVLESAIAMHGPDSVAILGSARATNEEAYLTQKFARVVLGTNNVDCCARVCHTPSAAALKQMFGAGAATNSFDDIEIARSILIFGCNPTENHPIVGARIKQAALHGARLIVIDPRKIELSKFAEVHLQIRPGANIPLLNAMANVIVEEELYDARFVDERIDNWDDFRQFIQQYPPEIVSALCGVQPDLIRRAARIYAQTPPGMCFHGLGATEHIQGTETVMCLANLALLCGNIGKPGCGINPLRGQNNVQGAAHMGCDPDLLTGAIPLKTGRPLFQRAWKTEIPDRKGFNLMEMMDAAEDGRLKVLWSIGYDVLLTNPNASRTGRALHNLDAVIIQDLFLTETARACGTIFLPACSSFEKDGTFMNAERRIQRIRKALSLQGASRPDWEIICQVAKQMGKADFFSFASPKDIWEEIRTVWTPGAGITYDRLDHRGLQWPCLDESDPGTTILHRDTFPRGRRASLHCAAFRQSPEVATSEYPYILITGRALQQFNSGTMTSRGQHNLLRSTDYLDMSPIDAKQLAINEGDRIRLRSHYGEAILPVHITDAVSSSQLFATFHDAASRLNCVTGPFRDPRTDTPEYKRTAVRLER